MSKTAEKLRNAIRTDFEVDSEKCDGKNVIAVELAVIKANNFIKQVRNYERSRLNAIADKVAYTLENSLGECVQGNEYRIRPIERQFWIEHKAVGSSEPLRQWIETEVKQAINSNFNKEDKEA